MPKIQCPDCKGVGFKQTSQIPPAARKGLKPLTEPCRNCFGNTKLPDGTRCPICHGTGQRLTEMSGELTYACQTCEGSGKVHVYTCNGVLCPAVYVQKHKEKWVVDSPSLECQEFVNGLLQEKTFDNVKEQVVALMQQHGFLTYHPNTLSMDIPTCQFDHFMTLRAHLKEKGLPETLIEDE